MDEEGLKLYRRPLSACLLVLLAFSFSYVTSHATEVSAMALVKVDPSTTYATVGENFTVRIEIENVEGLYGVEITISWDNSVLKCVNATPMVGVDEHFGGILNGKVLLVANNISQYGTYKITAASMPPAPTFNGTGTVASLEFRVIAEGTSKLELSAVLASAASTGKSTAIDRITADGFFGNTAPFDWQTPALIASAIIVIALLAGTILYMRSGKRYNK